MHSCGTTRFWNATAPLLSAPSYYTCYLHPHLYMHHIYDSPSTWHGALEMRYPQSSTPQVQYSFSAVEL
jgi:hypothetical protein